MKKQVKVISIVLVIMMAVLSISSVVLANSTGTDLSGTISAIGKGNGTDTGKIADFGKTLVTILQTIGVVVAIVVLLVLGIKYMMGSAEEKAEYKKTMIPYLIGAALIFGASTIVTVVYSVITSGAAQG